ncbi:MAG: glycerophosphodiester phosphodiesterase [Opitutaceae bacterium]|nr:glycerophosphodiester phosphodiesterase [Cytophagales bacterium]
MKKPLYLILAGISLLGSQSCKKKSSDPEPTATPALVNATPSQWKTLNGQQPLVIGHRGYAGLRPDHTLAGYKLAIDNGADFVEPDLVMTKDSILVCRHEPNIKGTTDVASHSEFASRMKTRKVDGLDVADDWFVSDFTLAELKTLRAVQPMANRSKAYDGLYTIPTFQEMIDLVKSESIAKGRTVGIYPETKHPTYHEDMGYKLTDKVLKVLSANGWNNAESPVYLQSFEVGNLQYARSKSTVKIVQLIDADDVTEDGKISLVAPYDKPYDFAKAGKPETFEYLTTNAGLDFVKTYANGIGPWKPYIISYLNKSPKQKLTPTNLIQRAHERNLVVHAYTFRDEESRLLPEYFGDPHKEYKDFYDLGVDGVFSDFTSTAVAARK